MSAFTDPTASEDEVARQMIERIAREVDLEAGRVPRTEDEGDADAPEADAPEAAVDEPTPEPEERSEEAVSRELVERIAREVDEGRPG
jgi:hypothetical protein